MKGAQPEPVVVDDLDRCLSENVVDTFEAIRLIKQNLPGALTHVGLAEWADRLDHLQPKAALA